MEKLVRITHHPAGRVGLALGFLVGFVAAFMGEARKIFLFIGLFAGLIAFWQHALFSGVRPELPPSSKQQVDKGD